MEMVECVSPAPVCNPRVPTSKRTVATAAFRRQPFVANFPCTGDHFEFTVCAQMFVLAMSTICRRSRPCRSLVVAFRCRPLSVIVGLVLQ